MKKKLRLFFALEPEDYIRQEIHAVQRKLACTGRIIAGEQLLITLAFLGQQAPEVLPDLCSRASRLHFEPCTLVLDRLRTFGGANVLWLGATMIPASLRDFHQALLGELQKGGIALDRKSWEPHLTLYRRLRNKPAIMETVAVSWRLNQFSLMESINVKGGVEYCRQGHWKSGSSLI